MNFNRDKSNIPQENRLEYFEKKIILIRNPLDIIISSVDEEYKYSMTLLHPEITKDLYQLKQLHAPLKKFNDHRYLPLKSRFRIKENVIQKYFQEVIFTFQSS